jgi:hypothetical protein
MAVEPIIDPVIQRDDTLLCGRLVALSTTRTALQVKQPLTDTPFQNALSIDFPAMPDTIELMRTAEYKVLSNVVLPDGVHQYMKTNPLEIPFSFRLHAEDSDFCPQGALTLLQLAARLHSFILPISRGNKNSTVSAHPASTTVLTDDTPPQNTPATPKPGAPDQGLQQAQADSNASAQTAITGANDVFNPVTCWLHLMFIDDNQPGISCIGYVKEVGVKLNGPWRRSVAGGFNLPTSGDFSFTFVHRPGHGNSNFAQSIVPNSVALQPQAYANDVKDRLYNTRNLVVAANYTGLENPES